MVSSLSGALRLLGEALEPISTSSRFVSAQTSWDANVKGTDAISFVYRAMIDLNGSRVCKVEDRTRASGHGGISRTVSTRDPDGHPARPLRFSHCSQSQPQYHLASRTGRIWKERNTEHTRPVLLEATSMRRFPVLGPKRRREQ